MDYTEKMRGQGYNGCASTKGFVINVSPQVKTLYPTAVYMYCTSHVFNLVISNAFRLLDVDNSVTKTIARYWKVITNRCMLQYDAGNYFWAFLYLVLLPHD